MLEALRKLLETSAGKVVAAVVILAGLVFVYVSARNVMTSEAEESSANRMFIDIETGKPFRYRLSEGDTIPVDAPSGEKKGFPAEACYWTKDGKAKEEPTWVMTNNWKNSRDPTFCPDCGRLVVTHNPAPEEGRNPPPTKEEYAQRGPRRR